MSATSPDTLNILEQIARIERSQDEARKFAAEQHKLAAEQSKLAAEQSKLAAEAEKFRLDRFLSPLLAAGAVAGAVSALIPLILRAWGG